MVIKSLFPKEVTENEPRTQNRDLSLHGRTIREQVSQCRAVETPGSAMIEPFFTFASGTKAHQILGGLCFSFAFLGLEECVGRRKRKDRPFTDHSGKLGEGIEPWQALCTLGTPQAQ